MHLYHPNVHACMPAHPPLDRRRHRRLPLRAALPQRRQVDDRHAAAAAVFLLVRRLDLCCCRARGPARLRLRLCSCCCCFCWHVCMSVCVVIVDGSDQPVEARQNPDSIDRLLVHWMNFLDRQAQPAIAANHTCMAGCFCAAPQSSRRDEGDGFSGECFLSSSHLVVVSGARRCRLCVHARQSATTD